MKAWRTIVQSCLKNNKTKSGSLETNYREMRAAQDFCISLYLSCGIFRSTKKPDSVFGRKKEVLEIHCKETLD